jgi:hypothetical protein
MALRNTARALLFSIGAGDQPDLCDSGGIHGDRPGCDFMVTTLPERRANTGTSTGRLLLAVLGGLADVERDLIRYPDGRPQERTKAQGKHMGRLPSLTSALQKEAIRRRARGATLQELARRDNVSQSTIFEARRMKGHWIGRYTGTNSGTITVFLADAKPRVKALRYRAGGRGPIARRIEV